MSNILVWGAGNGGLNALASLNSEVNVIAFIDNYYSGTEFEGYRVIRPHEIKKFHYDYILIAAVKRDEIVEEALRFDVPYQKILSYYCENIFDTRIAVLNLISKEIYSRGIEGSCAELGVYKGEFSKYINRAFEDRKLYLFDTFEGFSERDVEYETKNNISISNIGELCNPDIDLVIKKMVNKNNCIVKKGYFPDTTIDMPKEEKFCFVSLDADLYNPMKGGLEYFYPRLSQGGYIMIHDYNAIRFTGVKKAVYDYLKEAHIAYVPINDSGRSIVICK